MIISAKLMVTALMAILAAATLCEQFQRLLVTAAVSGGSPSSPSWSSFPVAAPPVAALQPMLNSFSHKAGSSATTTGESEGVFVVTQPADCHLLTSDLHSNAAARPSDAEWLLLIFQCDTKPMIRLYEKLWQRVNNKTIGNQWDLFFGGGMNKSPEQVLIWREYLSFDCFINHFITEARYALSHQDYCSYSTISRIGQLRAHVLGSRLLSEAYDMITIQYHGTCLEKALNKLPQVPYLVREVVDIYVGGAEQPIPDLNSAAPNFAGDESEELDFDVNLAVATNGPLEYVVPLTISLPFGTDPLVGVQAFKKACKEFCIELEERWQSMDMMNKMLATAGNGIETFNNYVMRLLIPTKYADACSKLSATG